MASSGRVGFGLVGCGTLRLEFNVVWSWSGKVRQGGAR